MLAKRMLFTALVSSITFFIYIYTKQEFEVTEAQISNITYFDFEKDLCVEPIKTEKNLNGGDCPKKGIVTVIQGGRLGNQIWEYISVWAVARKTGLSPYVPKCIKSTLEKMFENLSLPVFDQINHCPIQATILNNYHESYPYKSTDSITLPKYIVEPKLVATYIEDALKQLRIKKSLLEKSQQILHSAMKSTKKPIDTFVGVHVRRTDYTAFLKRKYDVQAASIKFFKAAIDYFQKKYKNSIFIIVTDDPKWAKQNFKSKSVYIPGNPKKNNPPELDMTILASCNHSIIDYGTFGQWGALLAGGETIFYPIYQKYSTEKLSSGMSNWHTL